MSTLYYIKNKRDYCYLNTKGGWNRSIGTYGLASFESKEAALAAIPDGFDCLVEPRSKKEKTKSDVDYVLYFKSKLFSKEETFILADKKDESVFKFASEAEAGDKALSLKLDMDFVHIDDVKKK